MMSIQAIDLKRTALLLIGYQRDYFDPDGILNGVIDESSRVNGTLQNTKTLIDELKGTDITMVSTPIVFTETYEELDKPIGILKTIKEVEAFKTGTSGAETIDMVAAFGDRVMEIPGKKGFDAFSSTDLLDVLAQRSIEHVVIAGAVTSVCVNATAMRAFDEGYTVTIISDCTSGRTTIEQTMFCEEIFPLFAHVMTHQELLGRMGAIA